LTRISTWKASKIIFVSNHSREVTSRQLGIPNEKGIAVHHGVSKHFNPNIQVDPEFRKYQPYILSVSTIYRQKNYIPLIRAFAKLLKECGLQYNLLIAGRTVHSEYFEQMKKTIVDEDIGWSVYLLDEVKHTQIPGLYAGARLLAFPSYRETFGLPTIEAMASGVPVVSSNASVMPEICGDAALYFDPFDTDELAEVMYKLLTDDQLWERMRRRGIERSKEFSWDRAASQTISVIEQAFRSR
jgi:glycosyltransferase involved in cell wall biosynthesis